MHNKKLKTFLFIITSLFSISAFAATWNATTHDLAAGDFNADGRDDMLYIAKNPSGKSGIVLSDESGDLTILLQEWDSNHLGLAWHSGTYIPHVGDFDGDGQADVFLDHKTTGTNYILHSDDDFEISEKSMTITDTAFGLDWGSSRLVFGDFDGDLKTDVYLQPKDAQTASTVVYSNGTTDTWANEHLGFQWSQNDAMVYAGNFDGLPGDELLVQAKPDWVMIPYSDLVIPVQRFEDQANGIVKADGNGKFSAGVALDFWSSEFLNINWSPDKYQIIVGRYNDDNRDDLLLQALQLGQESYILLANASGQFSNEAQVQLTLNSSYSAETFIISSSDFDSDGQSELYLQSINSSGDNYLANTNASGATISQVLHDSSNIFPFTPPVNEPPPVTVAPDNDSTLSESGLAVGKLPGSFSVNSHGAANYNIPISGMPVVGNVNLQLSLQYNSQSGNGLLGNGWNLSGLSTITRCPKTMAQDNEVGSVTHSNSDRFCLDGQRLMLHSGTYGNTNSEYRTEIETFQRIKVIGSSVKGPGYFVVEDKYGLKRWYGYTQTDNDNGSNVKIKVNTGSVSRQSVTHLWALAKIEDRYGNKIEFNYAQNLASGDAEYWPESVVSRNAEDTIIGKTVFNTSESRTDKRSYYVSRGGKISSSRRLNRIDVFGTNSAGGTPVIARSYFLDYEYGTIDKRSYLNTVQLCADSSRNNDNCMSPSTFTWQHGSRGYSSDEVYSQYAGDSDENLTNSFLILDIYGTGKTDFIKTNPQGNGSILDFNGDGRQDVLLRSHDGAGITLNYSNDGKTLDQIHYGPNLTFSQIFNMNTLAADFERDGLAEVVFERNQKLCFYKNTQTEGFSQAFTCTNISISPNQRITSVELDGDGIPEVFVSSDDDGPFSSMIGYVGFLKWNGSGFSQVQKHVTSSGFGGVAVPYMLGGPTETELKKLHFTDLNSDGFTDYVELKSGQLHSYINNGNYEFFKSSWTTAFTDDESFERVKSYDYNMDGLPDIAITNDNDWIVYQSNGDGSFEKLVVNNGTLSVKGNKKNSGFLDYNGDGVLDYMYRYGSGARTMGIVLGTGVKNGKLVHIEDGLGSETSISYKPMTSEVYLGHEVDPNSTYGSKTPAIYPVQNIMAPIELVSSVRQDNALGANGYAETVYGYAGAKQSLDGRGFLGFAKMRSYNVDRQITTDNYYRQDFPFAGTVVRSMQWRPNVSSQSGGTNPDPTDPLPSDPGPGSPGPADPDIPNFNLQKTTSTSSSSLKTVSPTTYTVAKSMNVGQATDSTLSKDTRNIVQQINSIYNRPMPFISNSVEESYKLINSDVIRRVSTETRYLGEQGRYGCATNIDVTVDDGNGGDVHSTTTVNTFTSTEENLCLLKNAKVTQSRANYGTPNLAPQARTRESAFTYFDNGWLQSETVEPTGKWLTKTFGYDNFGNRETETITGQGITPRTTSINYDSSGLYPIQTTNALQHIENYTWDYRFGTKLSSTGPNSLTTLTQYDILGRVKRVVSPRSAKYITTEYERCASGCAYKVHQRDSAANNQIVSTTEYDRLDRVVSSSAITLNGDFSISKKLYDNTGRVYAESVPYFSNATKVCWNLKEYDNLDRVKLEVMSRDDSECTPIGQTPNYDPVNGNMGTLAFGSATKYLFDGLKTTTTTRRYTNEGTGFVDRSVERVANVMYRTRFITEYDDAGQAIKTEYDYDPLGNTTWVRDAAGNITQMAYDIRGNKTSMNDPDMGIWSYEFNALDELVLQTDAENQTVVSKYDALGRMYERSDSTSDGNLEGKTIWTYDSVFRGVGKLGSVTTYAYTEDGSEYATLRKQANYTNYGELNNSLTIIDGKRFAFDTNYDEFGRAEKNRYPSTDNSTQGVYEEDKRYTVANQYNEFGFLKEIWENDIGDYSLWQANTVDALGSVTKATLAGGVTEHSVIDQSKGYLEEHYAKTSSGTDIYDQAYAWDEVGNLTSRSDNVMKYRETYTYDMLSRLDNVTIFETTNGDNQLHSENHTYDAIGNLKNKGSGFIDYSYSATGVPHAVSSLMVVGKGSRTYTYDGNGNLKTVAGDDTDAHRSVDWFTFNKPEKITKDTYNYSEFFYGDDRTRYKQVAYSGSSAEQVTETTYYVGSTYELKKIETDKGTLVDFNTTLEHHHYIRAGGRVLAIAKKYEDENGNITNPETEINILHRDHQGSVIAITNRLGSAIQYLSYDAWGKRRDVQFSANTMSWSPASVGQFLTSSITKRGYTGHEMLDNVGLVHMNGRVYDAEVGRFLSADPFVQFPESTQGFNRYTYVANNPLSYNDPSGFFLKGLFASLAGSAVGNYVGQSQLGGLIGGYLATGPNAQTIAAPQFNNGSFTGVNNSSSTGDGGIISQTLEYENSEYSFISRESDELLSEPSLINRFFSHPFHSKIDSWLWEKRYRYFNHTVNLGAEISLPTKMIHRIAAKAGIPGADPNMPNLSFAGDFHLQNPLNPDGFDVGVGATFGTDEDLSKPSVPFSKTPYKKIGISGRLNLGVTGGTIVEQAGENLVGNVMLGPWGGGLTFDSNNMGGYVSIGWGYEMGWNIQRSYVYSFKHRRSYGPICPTVGCEIDK